MRPRQRYANDPTRKSRTCRLRYFQNIVAARKNNCAHIKNYLTLFFSLPLSLYYSQICILIYLFIIFTKKRYTYLHLSYYVFHFYPPFFLSITRQLRFYYEHFNKPYLLKKKKVLSFVTSK